MNCEIGDVIQIDGGLVIVTSVKGDRANIQPVTEFKGRRPHALDNGINVGISRDRLFERRGETGLVAFLKEQAEAKSGKRKGKIKTEPGDMLCYEGRICTIFVVEGNSCSIGDLDGNVWQEDRWLNEFFFRDCACHQLVRLNSEERAENLKQFLSQRKSPLPETKASDETEAPHIEIMKATKAKPKTKRETPAPKTAKTEQPTEGKRLVFGTSAVRVFKAAGKAGVTFDEAKAFATKVEIEIADATLKRALAIGKNVKGVDMADLDAAQLAEIKGKA